MNFELVLNQLKKTWGYESFRKPQEKLIKQLILDREVLGILPTGGGKSLCFQVPGLVLGGVTLVVSPLIALIDDQVNDLNLKGITAIALHSRLSKKQYLKEIDNALNGKYRFIYVSPEKLLSASFKDVLQNMPIKLIAIDEAHCISMWGFDFRPAYRKLGELRALFPKVYFIALTASANHLVLKDIKIQLLLENAEVIQTSLVRRNLKYIVRSSENVPKDIVSIIKKLNGCGLIYAMSRRQTVEISRMLQANNINSDFYHAGLTIDDRTRKQEKWIANETQILVCTNAFGMGINKPDVRFVIHAESPNNLASYYQEAGRAGRDGKKSYCILLNENAAAKVERSYNDQVPKLEITEKVYETLHNYFNIALGDGKGLKFNFNFKDLVENFEFTKREWSNALEVLKMQEIIALSDNYRNAEQVQILASAEDIKLMQDKYTQLDTIIQVLARKYGGLHTRLIDIDIAFIAQEAQMPKILVQRYLNRMKDLGLMDYVSGEQGKKITFLLERGRAYMPNIELIKTYTQQLEIGHLGIINYLKEKIICRNNIISSYFGVDEILPCGTCDNCNNLKNNNDYQIKFSVIVRELKQSIINSANKNDFINEVRFKYMHTYVLRELLERKDIILNKDKVEWHRD